MEPSRSTLCPHFLLQRDFFFPSFETQTQVEAVTFDLWAVPLVLSPAGRAPGVCFWTGVPPPDRHPC